MVSPLLALTVSPNNMNPDTLSALAASQTAFATAQKDFRSAARRVFKVARQFRDSRPSDESWLIEDHFGEWNREYNHIFWAETDFYDARLTGDKVELETGYTLRCETNKFWLDFPAEWLSLDDASLDAVLANEWNRLLQVAKDAAAKKEREQTWERYQTYLSLKEEFDGKSAPENPNP